MRSPIILLVISATACAAEQRSDEHVDSVASAVGRGNPDNIHSYVGGLTFKGGGNDAFCAGTLITPKFVLTANHCITNANNVSQQSSLDVVFAQTPATVPTGDPRRVQHTYTGSPIPVRFSNINGISENDAAHDVALIQLDALVPSSIASALHPAGVGGTAGCGGSFDSGTLVGYGKTHLYGSQPAIHSRNSQSSDGWSAESTTDGNAVLVNYWVIAPVPGDVWYRGALGGDSGGPLLDGAGDKVCGVISTTAGSSRWLA